MSERFDVVVLGGGPGGYAAALYAGAAGLTVALVEEDRVGGTCLHRGCVPAKELLQTAEVLRTVRGAAEFGVHAGEPVLALPESQVRKQQIVDKLAKGVEGLLKARKVVTVAGRGTVVDGPGRVLRVGDRDLTGDALVVATGSSPRSLPGLAFDGRRILSSDHVLTLDAVPPRVLVVGGGAIGCEFASLLADYGSEVILVETLPRLLAAADEQVSEFVQRRFSRRGIAVHTGATLRAIDGDDVLTVTFGTADGTETVVEVDAVVVSVGRAPRTADLGLEAAGIVLEPSGHVAVDPFLRTAVPGVYAVGDVVPTPQLAHVAFAEAIVAVKTILGEAVDPVDHDRVPWAIYSHPEVAWAGLTEAAARERGIEVTTSVHRFGGNSRALIVGEPDGFVKLVADPVGTLLGVHIVGPWATELIAEGYLAVNWEATAADVGSLVHAHPTLSELFGESALALTGRGLHG